MAKVRRIEQESVNDRWIAGSKRIDAKVEEYRNVLKSKGWTDEESTTPILNLEKNRMREALNKEIEGSETMYPEAQDFEELMGQDYNEMVPSAESEEDLLAEPNWENFDYESFHFEGEDRGIESDNEEEWADLIVNEVQDSFEADVNEGEDESEEENKEESNNYRYSY